MMEFSRLYRDADGDGDQSGGGAPAPTANPSDLSPTQDHAKTPASSFEMTTAQLSDRLRQAERRREQDLLKSGRLLTPEEAQNRADKAIADESMEREKLERAGKYEPLYAESVKKLKAEIDGRAGDLRVHKDELDGLIIQTKITNILNGEPVRDAAKETILRELVAVGKYEVREGVVICVDGDGNPIYSKVAENAGQYMEPREVIVEWLNRNDWALRPAHGGGSGTTPSAGRGNTLPSDWNTPEGYRKLSPQQQQEVAERVGLTIDKPQDELTFRRPA